MTEPVLHDDTDMTDPDMKILKFSINNWQHLYSLAQTVLRTDQTSGKCLSIAGTIRNDPIFDNRDIGITLNFTQSGSTPHYSRKAQHILLGKMQLKNGRLVSDITVDEHVYEELRKNLVEYADIDGIHIMVSIGLLLQKDTWPADQGVDIVQLDYAMRGDA